MPHCSLPQGNAVSPRTWKWNSLPCNKLNCSFQGREAFTRTAQFWFWTAKHVQNSCKELTCFSTPRLLGGNTKQHLESIRGEGDTQWKKQLSALEEVSAWTQHYLAKGEVCWDLKGCNSSAEINSAAQKQNPARSSSVPSSRMHGRRLLLAVLQPPSIAAVYISYSSVDMSLAHTIVAGFLLA